MVDRPFSVHGFRHTFNNLVRQVSHGIVQRAMTGHSSEQMSEHYSHVSLEEKREAVGSVLRLVRGGSKSLEPSLERPLERVSDAVAAVR